MKQVVIIENLVKKFGEFVAVNHISFEVYEKEIFGFLGANGAGKTTTIKILCGILPPTEGIAFVLGFNAFKESNKIKKEIGYMSQKFTLYEDLTVLENLNFQGGIRNLNTKYLKSKINEVLEFSNLKDRMNELTKNLPLGIKQRLALGCAILHNPKILFLDEPTAGVDPIARKNFWNLIYKLKEMGTTIFVTSHYMDEVEQCDRVAIMHEGRILVLGAPEELKQKVLNNKNSTLEDVFIKLIKNQQ
jgi:ABC-2 type transport system ATP-binding protein